MNTERLLHFLTATTLFHLKKEREKQGYKAIEEEEDKEEEEEEDGSLPGSEEVLFGPMKKAIISRAEQSRRSFC